MADRKDNKRERRERCKVMWNVIESRERIKTGGRKREEEIQDKGVSRLRGKTVAGAHKIQDNKCKS